MSADTTIVIAATKRGGERLYYTAGVVQAVEDLLEDTPYAFHRAKEEFLDGGGPWFSSLPRAKRFASLLAEEGREMGWLEYENRPIIEIGNDRIYLLSRRGKRIPFHLANLDRQ